MAHARTTLLAMRSRYAEGIRVCRLGGAEERLSSDVPGKRETINLRTLGTLLVVAASIAGCDDAAPGLAGPELPTGPSGPVVGSIALDLEADTLSVRQTTQLLATVLSVDGDTMTGQAITFESGDEDIAAISDAGLVTAVGPGTATIIARAGDRSATVTAYVRRAASISIAPTERTIGVFDTLRLTASVLDANGAPVPDTKVRWIDELRVPVVRWLAGGALTGTFLALAPGREAITAEIEGLRATIDITVVSTVGSVLLQPHSIIVTVDDTVRTTVIVRDTSGAVIANPEVVYLCQSAPGPDPGRRYGCGFRLITLDSNTFVFGPGSYMEGIVEVVARSGGVSSNTIDVFIAFGDPNNPWDY